MHIRVRQLVRPANGPMTHREVPRLGTRSLAPLVAALALLLALPASVAAQGQASPGFLQVLVGGDEQPGRWLSGDSAGDASSEIPPRAAQHLRVPRRRRLHDSSVSADYRAKPPQARRHDRRGLGATRRRCSGRRHSPRRGETVREAEEGTRRDRRSSRTTPAPTR